MVNMKIQGRLTKQDASFDLEKIVFSRKIQIGIYIKFRTRTLYLGMNKSVNNTECDTPYKGSNRSPISRVY